MMLYALNLADDGRILSATFARYDAANATVVEELPEGDIHDYLFVNGQYVYDPLPTPAPPTPAPSEESVWDELDAAYQEGVDSV